jgi:hypothetical protein
MTPNKTDGTKYLKLLIRHHGEDIKRAQNKENLKNIEIADT